MTDIKLSYAYEDSLRHVEIDPPHPPRRRDDPPSYIVCPTLTPHGKKGGHISVHLCIWLRL